MNQFEENFFIFHVEVNWDFVSTEFGEEPHGSLSHVVTAPVVVLLVVHIVELSLHGLSQQSYDLFEISFDIDGTCVFLQSWCSKFVFEWLATGVDLHVIIFSE